MSAHSPIGIGGPAEAFVIAGGVEELRRVIGWAMENAVDYRFHGSGSHTIVRDGGLRGLVIALGETFQAIEEERVSGEEHYVQVGAAVPVSRLLAWCAENGMTGLDALAGCRGTIGGTLLTNAGVACDALADLVSEITVVNREGRELTMKRAAFRAEEGRLRLPRTMAIVRALFLLRREGSDAPRAVRSEEQEEASLDNIFRNPGRTAAEILIEETGFSGVRVGGVRVAPAHANRIIGEGRAMARDAIILMNLIRERVREQTGTALELNIEIVGDER